MQHITYNLDFKTWQAWTQPDCNPGVFINGYPQAPQLVSVILPNPMASQIPFASPCMSPPSIPLQKDFRPQQLWMRQAPEFFMGHALSRENPEAWLPIYNMSPIVPTVNVETVGNSHNDVQTFQPHGAVETSLDQNFFRTSPQSLVPVNEAQDVQSHETSDTLSDKLLKGGVGIHVVDMESKSCFQKLQSNVRFWEHDPSMVCKIEKLVKTIERDFHTSCKRDQDHYRDFAQDDSDIHQSWENKWEIANSFLDVVTFFSKMLEQEGQKTRNVRDVHRSHMLIENLQSASSHMMRKSFDEKCAVAFSESVESKSLLRFIQKFKIKNSYVLSLGSLRRHQGCEMKIFNDFIMALKQTFNEFRAFLQPDRLQCFVQFMDEVAKIYESKMKKSPRYPRRESKRRVQALTEDCFKCLDFLKRDSFDPGNSIDFKGFNNKVRALKFNVLLFKMMKVPDCKLGENLPHDCEERGAHVIRLRLKRVCNCESEGFQLVKLLYQIRITNSVEIKEMLVRHDYKSPPRNSSNQNGCSQDRKLTGMLVYVTLSTDLEAEKILQLLFAWGERKEVRNLVFQRYPELCELQTDDLTDEQDRARANERQLIIRKSKSIPLYENIYDSEGNFLLRVRLEVDAQTDRIKNDESTRRSLCEVNLSQTRWSDHNLNCQKGMYHFDFAYPRGWRKQNPTATVEGYNDYINKMSVRSYI